MCVRRIKPNRAHLLLHVLSEQESKRLKGKNTYLNDLKMAAAEADKSKARDHELLSKSFATTIQAYKKHYGTSKKVTLPPQSTHFASWQQARPGLRSARSAFPVSPQLAQALFPRFPFFACTGSSLLRGVLLIGVAGGLSLRSSPFGSSGHPWSTRKAASDPSIGTAVGPRPESIYPWPRLRASARPVPARRQTDMRLDGQKVPYDL